MPRTLWTEKTFQKEADRTLVRARQLVTVDQLQEALETGDIDPLITQLAGSGDFEKLFAAGIVAPLTSDVESYMAMEFAAKHWGLDPKDEYVGHWLRTYGLDKAKELSASTIDGIRTALDANLYGGSDPRVAAQTIRPWVGLTDRQMGAVNRRYFSYLEQGMRRDIARTKATAYYERLREYRAMTIARTEINAAQNHGLLEAWRQGAGEGRINIKTYCKVWTAALGNERTCEVCLDLDGVRVRINETFPGGFDCPPAHPNGRCSMYLVEGETTAEMQQGI